jgi:hypothetical protein
MELKMIVTTLQPDKGFVKGEAEETTVLKAKLRKASYTSEEDGQNLKAGTGDPWGSVVIRGFDEKSFAELGELKPGDVVTVIVNKRGKK